MPRKPVGVAAVERAMTILGAFRAGDHALGLQELVDRTSLSKSTVLRILISLERYHCVLRREDGRYQLGPALLHLGSLYLGTLRLEDHVLPVLQRLAQDTGESASFYTREKGLRVCLFRVDSPHSVRDHVRVGDLLPLDRGAAGHVLMRFDAGRAADVPPPESPLIVTFGEQDPDSAGIAAPVYAAGRSLRGAISLSGPISRFTPEAIARMSPRVLSAAIALSERLGGDTAPLTDTRSNAAR
ncbi:MAG: IclR family transcriptional regulator [Burkholderiaceae bacterium]